MDNDPYAALGGDSGEPSEKPAEKKADGETALLSKSFFAGQDVKPGEQYDVEVVRQYEDEVEVKYPKQVKEDKEKPTAEADTALDEMAGDGGDVPANPGGMGGY